MTPSATSQCTNHTKFDQLRSETKNHKRIKITNVIIFFVIHLKNSFTFLYIDTHKFRNKIITFYFTFLFLTL